MFLVTTVFNMEKPYTLLTAVWNQEYELSYDANGGTGALQHKTVIWY